MSSYKLIYGFAIIDPPTRSEKLASECKHILGNAACVDCIAKLVDLTAKDVELGIEMERNNVHS